MNALTFLKCVLAMISKRWAIVLVDACMDMIEAEDLILPNKQARARTAWQLWLKQRRGRKWEGYALGTMSTLASMCGSRPEVLMVCARIGYKVALQAAYTHAHEEGRKVAASPFNEATEDTITTMVEGLKGKAKARLDKLAHTC